MKLLGGGEKTDWVGKEWAGPFFPRGKNWLGGNSGLLHRASRCCVGPYCDRMNMIKTVNSLTSVIDLWINISVYKDHSSLSLLKTVCIKLQQVQIRLFHDFISVKVQEILQLSLNCRNNMSIVSTRSNGF